MWGSKEWNNKTSDIKLVYLYSTIKMMHGPIHLRFRQRVLRDLRFRDPCRLGLGSVAVKYLLKRWRRFASPRTAIYQSVRINTPKHFSRQFYLSWDVFRSTFRKLPSMLNEITVFLPINTDIWTPVYWHCLVWWVVIKSFGGTEQLHLHL
jgi:hypothetical protein